MHPDRPPSARRRWFERLVLTAMVLAGFGIGSAGVAMIGEQWTDDPVLLDEVLQEAEPDPGPDPAPEPEPIDSLALLEVIAEPEQPDPPNDSAVNDDEGERRPHRGRRDRGRR